VLLLPINLLQRWSGSRIERQPDSVVSQ
jgi:hypothetical protein